MDTDFSINDQVLTELMGALNTAIGAIPTFANASQAVINSVLITLIWVPRCQVV